MQSRVPLFAGSVLLTVGGDAVQLSSSVNSIRGTSRYRASCAGAVVGSLVYLFAQQDGATAGTAPVAGTPGDGFPLLTGESVDIDLLQGCFYSVGSDDATAVVVLSPLV